MPWTPEDAERHTRAQIANERLTHTGDEARAIREANAVVARQSERNY
jgi:hypothetical protein